MEEPLYPSRSNTTGAEIHLLTNKKYEPCIIMLSEFNVWICSTMTHHVLEDVCIVNAVKCSTTEAKNTASHPAVNTNIKCPKLTFVQY